MNDKFILNYSFKTIYKQNNKSERIKLINKFSISEMIIYEKKVEKYLSINYSFNDTESHEYIF